MADAIAKLAEQGADDSVVLTALKNAQTQGKVSAEAAAAAEQATQSQSGAQAIEKAAQLQTGEMLKGQPPGQGETNALPESEASGGAVAMAVFIAGAAGTGAPGAGRRGGAA